MRSSAERGAGENGALCPAGRQSPMWKGQCQEWCDGFHPALVNPPFCLLGPSLQHPNPFGVARVKEGLLFSWE